MMMMTVKKNSGPFLGSSPPLVCCDNKDENADRDYRGFSPPLVMTKIRMVTKITGNRGLVLFWFALMTRTRMVANKYDKN